MAETLAERFETLSSLFEKDHLRMACMLDAVQALCEARSYLSAARLFGEFRQLQEHHLDGEERALGQLSGAGTCPNELREALTREHLGIRELMTDVGNAISQNDETKFSRSVELLGRWVLTHNDHETQQFLPALFRGMPAEQRESEVRRIVS